MSNAASVIVTLGAILLMLIAMQQSNINSDNGWPDITPIYIFAIIFSALAFIGSLVGYVIGHRRGKDEASSAIVCALVSALGIPLLIGAIALLLHLLGFFK
jgi:NADH:ubiquinone oxidoreductase subunit 2 (subunit N)